MLLTIHVGAAKAAGQHPADVITRLKNKDTGSLLRSSNASHDSTSSASINDDIRLFDLGF
jgi:hypothetical protein